jgi:hypothetical protein
MGSYSRRTFLKLAGASLTGVACASLPPVDQPPVYGLARSTAYDIVVRSEPDPNAPVLRKLRRDEIVTVLEQITGDHGPQGNPRWFRLLDGFAHSGYLQEVRYDFNPVVYDIPSGGKLAEVSVPYTQSRDKPSAEAPPLYRLYYQAVFWVVETVMDETGHAWYGLQDDRLAHKYYVSADHLRLFAEQELAPVSTDVPAEAKRIEVDLTKQSLTAFENDQAVFTATISSGWLRKDPKPGEGRTFTPIGHYSVFEKTPSRHMGDGRLTSELDANELPGVPFVSFFHMQGTAFHGVYWHNNFGVPCSEGCINMRPNEARWLYRWIYPTVAYVPDPPQFIGKGTKVYLHD